MEGQRFSDYFVKQHHYASVVVWHEQGVMMQIDNFIQQPNVGADLSRPPPIYRPNGRPTILGLFCETASLRLGRCVARAGRNELRPLHWLVVSLDISCII